MTPALPLHPALTGLTAGRKVEPVATARTTLPPESSSVAVARRWAQLFLEGNGAELQAPTTVLLLSELVTNSVVHGRSEFTVEVHLTEQEDNGLAPVVRVSVEDGDSRLPRFNDLDDDAALGGRGLRIVASLAARYGVTELPYGKSVWFELDRTPSDPYPVDTSPDRVSKRAES